MQLLTIAILAGHINLGSISTVAMPEDEFVVFEGFNSPLVEHVVADFELDCLVINNPPRLEAGLGRFYLAALAKLEGNLVAFGSPLAEELLEVHRCRRCT